MSQLQNYSTSSIANPQANFAPIRQAGLDQINRSYMDLPQELTQQLSRRGYGSSGQLGNTLFRTGLARSGAVSGFEGSLAQEGINQQNRGATLGTQLLQLGRGTSTTGTSTSPDVGLSGGLLSAGSQLGNISLLMMLQKVLGGGGASGAYKDASGQTPADWGWK
jgi:hypothetical protein